MKVGILAGGLGTRLLEETLLRPKPLVEVGGRPILWHVMGCYARHGFTEFVVALGYKGELITRYMAAHASPQRPATATPGRSSFRLRAPSGVAWVVDLVDTGQATMNAGRLRRLAPYLGEGTFMLANCDGLSDMDLSAMLAFHRAHGRRATVAAVRPPARFGRLDLDGDRVVAFTEKPRDPTEWINGGFYVLEPEVLGYIEGDLTEWERGPLERLASEGHLMAYRHGGFWQCMDTVHDKRLLDELWNSGNAPWSIGS